MLSVLVAAACPYPSPQGSQVYIRGVSEALARAGHAVRVACYGHGTALGASTVPVLRTPRVPGYTRLRSGPDPVRPFVDLALAHLVAHTSADVVFAHHVEALGAALLARRRTRVPVVYAAHTLLGEELSAYFPARGARFFDALGRAADHLARCADAVVALSDRAAERFVALGCRRVSVIPPGLDPAEVTGVVPRRRHPARTVVYAGNPDAYQDLPLLAAALRSLPGIRLLVVTAAPARSVRRALGRLEDLDIVHAPAWSVARGWIAGADVSVVPRRTCAGVPIKLLNSLGLGVPTVVGPDVARGLPGEVVADPTDPVAFGAGILRAFSVDRPDPATILGLLRWDDRVERLRGVFDVTIAATARVSRL